MADRKMFLAGSEKYAIYHTGHIEQISPRKYIYDSTYTSTYNKPEYENKTDVINALRLGFVIGTNGGTPDQIIEMGYGTGSFMKKARELINTVSGYDISGVPVPADCNNISVDGKPVFDRHYNKNTVVCFFDCLEHVPLKTLRKWLRQIRICNYKVCISLPNCDYEKKGLDWFTHEYPHRKPNEHLRHFTKGSLTKFMRTYYFKPVAFSYHEDLVRKRYPENILTMTFEPFGAENISILDRMDRHKINKK